MACLAQFYPKKYPDNFWLLAACVPAYVVLSSLMTGAGRRLGGRAAQWKWLLLRAAECPGGGAAAGLIGLALLQHAESATNTMCRRLHHSTYPALPHTAPPQWWPRCGRRTRS